MDGDLYGCLACRAVAEVERHSRRGPLGQQLLFDAAHVEDVLTAVKLDASFLTQSGNPANGACIIRAVVFEQLHSSSLIVFFDAPLVKARQTFLFVLETSTEMTTRQLFVAAFVADFNAFFLVTAGSKRGIFAL